MELSRSMTARERAFCSYYACLGDGQEAALRAGYSSKRAVKTATALLRREEIRREVDQLQRGERERCEAIALAGLRRVAFGRVNDAVRLLSDAELPPEEMAELDLFSVSEIRRARGGGCEIRFYDRSKALGLLLEYGREGAGAGGSLLEALERGARAAMPPDDDAH